jgi:5-epi-alpha-selinene synthase
MLQRLATRTSKIVGCANDLFTCEKEIIQGQIHNLVLVLMNEGQLPIEEAVAQVMALHDNEVHGFLQEVEQLPSFGIADAGVQRYVEMLKCWIRGHLDWAYETGRYRPYGEPAGGPIDQLTGTPAAA